MSGYKWIVEREGVEELGIDVRKIAIGGLSA